jgi:polysaccharide deacetylase family protein (PEP-CTERM system associated)
VDVEEYFQVAAFEGIVPRAVWPACESRVERGVVELLELLERHGAQATFFVLGWLAERRPSLVRTIVAAGHELASHGWDHRRVTEQTAAAFHDSVRRTKRVLEDAAGVAVVGFRAPSFSIVPGREWALDLLIAEGYLYDSSLFPVRRRGYGYPGGGRDPHWVRRPLGRLLEVPPAVWRCAGVNIPAGGGAYFRIFPYGITRAAFQDCERRGAPGTFYVHPWELDPGQPRVAAPLAARIRHYTGLPAVRLRLERLLGEFRFTAIRDTLAAFAAAESRAC